MGKNNHKKAINILNRINFDDVTLMRELLYLIAEHNPYSIIKADMSLSFPANAAPVLSPEEYSAKQICKKYNPFGKYVESVKEMRSSVNLGLKEAKTLIDKYWTE